MLQIWCDSSSWALYQQGLNLALYLSVSERPESFVVPEGLDFVVPDSGSVFAVQSKEESFDCEMVESFDCEMAMERAAVQIDLMVYRLSSLECSSSPDSVATV